MSLSFDLLLDRIKHKMLGFAGDTGFRDDLIRTGTFFRDFKLTAAQLDALNATPVEIVPAPGAGLVVLVERIFTKVDFQATRLELGAGTIQFLYTDGSGDAVATAVPNTQVELDSDVFYHSVGLAVVPLANAKIVAKASADVTAGDSILYGRVYYKVIKHSELF